MDYQNNIHNLYSHQYFQCLNITMYLIFFYSIVPMVSKIHIIDLSYLQLYIIYLQVRRYTNIIN